MWPIPFHHLLIFSGFSPAAPWSSAATSHLGTALPVQYHMTQSGLRSVYKPPHPSPFPFLRFELVEYFATVASHPPLLLLLLLLALLSSTNQIPFESVTIVFGDSFGVAATLARISSPSPTTLSTFTNLHPAPLWITSPH